MPGTYAPPAVEFPKTTAMVGSPAAERCVRSRKPRPPGMKISDCVGRSAPPDSTRLTDGSRFSRAMSDRRDALRMVKGLVAPPRTVGSLAEIMHSVPLTTPMPETRLAPTVYERAPRGQGGDLEKRCVAVQQQLDALVRRELASAAGGDRHNAAPPPARANASCPSTSARASSMAARLRR